MQTSKESQKELYQVAESQGGYFTAKQAASLGFASNKRAYHVHAGNWLREHRGIYRLALFPEPDRSDLILWWLWSRDRSDQPSGIYSHHGTVPTAEQQVLFQVPVTSALRSIRDVWEEGSLPKDTIRQAFEQARASGKITQRQVAELRKDPRRASLARALEAA